MNNWKSWAPIALMILCAGWILGSFRLPAEKELQSHAFGRIPVVEKGRPQPFDSFARNSLMLIREKQSANLEPWKGEFGGPKIISATEWAMELAFKPEVGDTRPVFRIVNPEVVALLALPTEPSKENQTDAKHFSWNQLQPRFNAFKTEARRAFAKKDSKERNAYENSLVELWSAIGAYKQVKYLFGPCATGDLTQGLTEYLGKISKGGAAFQAQMANEAYDAASLDWANDQFSTPLLVPPHRPELKEKNEWTRMLEEVASIQRGQKPDASLVSFSTMAKAYRAGDAEGLRNAANEYLSQLASTEQAKTVTKAAREQRFNFVQPFYKGTILCVVAFLLALMFWISPAQFEWARRAAVWLMVLTLVVHAGGLIFRMVQEGRPPVTNLYSSAIFIGLAAVIFGLILEGVFPHGIGVIVAAAVDFCALLIAHHLALGGDTMVMLQAVLDTNFWLATHVVAVTLGYAATFMAGFLAIIWVLTGTFSKKRLAEPVGITATNAGDMAMRATVGGVVSGVTGEVVGHSLEAAGAAKKESARPLGKIISTMIYAIICFATLFSFVGTVLGGIWADQSWGRFWGWDVKENGALMIVLWNAIVLHARWGGVAKERGIAALAIGGNIVTAWSWFGVNMLGIGLHSYGFMGAAFYALITFIISQLVLIAIAYLGCRPESTPRGLTAPKTTPPAEPLAA